MAINQETIVVEYQGRDNLSGTAGRVGASLEKNTGSVERLINRLKLQEAQLKKGMDAYQLWRADVNGATDAQMRQIQALQQNIKDEKRAQAVRAGTTKQLRMMRGGFGQLGHQIQDVAVQLQMGQNAMLVFGQQGSQILSIFGGWGAIAGAVLAVGGALGTYYMASKDAKQATSDLEKVMQELSKTISVDLKTDTVGLSDDFANLARSFSAFAQVTLRQRYVQSLEASRVAQQAFSNETSDLLHQVDRLQKRVGDPTSFQNSSAAARNLAETYGLSADSAVELANAIKLSQFGGEGIEILSDMVEEMATGTYAANTQFINFAYNLLSTVKGIKDADAQAKFLEETIGKGLPKALEEFNRSADKNELESFIASLKAEAETFGMTESQIGMYNAEKLIAKHLSEENAVAVRGEIQALYELLNAKRMAAEQEAMIASISSPGTTDRLAQIENEFKSERDLFMEHQEEKLRMLNEHEEKVNSVLMDYAALRKQINDETVAYEQAAMMTATGNILTSMQSQVGQMQNVFDQASGIGKAFYVASQALAAGQAIIGGIVAKMNIIRNATAIGMDPGTAMMLGTTAELMGYASAGAILGQTVASFEGGGVTFNGVRSGGLDGKGGRMALVHPNEKITDLEKDSGNSGPVSVHFNISANDTKGFDQLLNDRRGMIVSMINKAINDKGRRGLI